MVVVAGTALRIEPHAAATDPDVYTALAELVVPEESYRLVAVVTATALLGTEPAMGFIRLWDKTYDGFNQVRFYGTQTITITVPTVSVGDLVQVMATPYLDAGGVWAGARVWVHSAEVTLVGFAEVDHSNNSYAPPAPPIQVNATDGTSQTTIGYSTGDGWGLPATGTAWRFRPLGADDWQVVSGQSASGAVVLPFDLIDSGLTYEVQGSQTTGAGTSVWGETVEWAAADVGGPGPPDPDADGYGLSEYGTNYGS